MDYGVTRSYLGHVSNRVTVKLKRVFYTEAFRLKIVSYRTATNNENITEFQAKF